MLFFRIKIFDHIFGSGINSFITNDLGAYSINSQNINIVLDVEYQVDKLS